MEKCTYCTQRINRARIDAKLASRELRDGDVKTACQQACPASAIEFGNLRDASSRIVKAKADPRNYALLEELNTKPRTTYLAKVRNPNPELDPSSPGQAQGRPEPSRGATGSGSSRHLDTLEVAQSEVEGRAASSDEGLSA